MKLFRITKRPEIRSNKIIDIYELHISKTSGGGTTEYKVATADNIQILEDYAKIYIKWIRDDGIDYVVKEFDP